MKGFLIGTLLSYSVSLFSQVGYDYNETVATFKDGKEHPIYVVEIKQATEGDVTKALLKLMNKATKEKLIVGEDFNLAKNAVLKKELKDTIDIYSRVIANQGSLVSVFFGFESNGNFISSSTNPSKSKALEGVVRKFAADQYKRAVEKEWEDENDKLKGMEKGLKEAVDKNEKMRKEVLEKELFIEEENQDIAANKGDQTRKVNQIQEQKTKISKIDPEQKELLKSERGILKGFENDLEKLKNTNKKTHKDVFKARSDIRELKLEIEKNEIEQIAKRKDIAQQTAIRTKVDEKLKELED